MHEPAESTAAPLVLGGVAIDRLGWDEALDAVLAAAAERPVRVTWVYANCINVARDDAAYRTALNAAEFTLNDGVGIELAGRWRRQPVRANLCGTDLIPALLDRLDAAATGNDAALRRLYLLGTRNDVLQQAQTAIAARWSALDVVGHHHGFFADPAPVLAAIAQAQPQVLIVATGVPRQERFLYEHWDELTAGGVHLALAGGAIVDHLGGAVTRAPRWVRRLRLEWFYRLLGEPRRLWRRYVLGNARFLWELWREGRG